VDTSAALGARVAAALASRGPVQSIVLGHRPHADDDTVLRLLAGADLAAELVVSVGSGTLTDLGKMLAFRRGGLPHVAFGTAPSMNGFASVSASITSGGLKRSIRVAAPTAVFLDTRVLAAAPVRMIRAGLGDSLCRATAQTDWLLAHLLLGRPYRTAPFALLAADEPELFAGAAALVAGDRAVMRRLARTLVLSGCGMTLCGGSYPASQGEHLVSHYFDVMHPRDDDAAPLHGEQVGVATLAMARLQEELLRAATPPRLRESVTTFTGVTLHFGAALGLDCWREVAPKLMNADDAEERTARLATIWDDLRARVAALSLPAARLTSVLAAAGAATQPSQLGWAAPAFTDALAWARCLRDRYTFLDLAADAREHPER
ncbi:MAG TPA: iron-containing alcohol dehydrogenase, partial [Kofleriaceae bacterium]|nr:iron-containing alcohol dehydrogenase [Kofleriaceae bacterium]